MGAWVLERAGALLKVLRWFRRAGLRDVVPAQETMVHCC